MFVESVVEDVQMEGLIKVLEENLSQMVAFADDDGILVTQVAEAGKSRSEHRMRGYVTETTFFVEFL